MSTQAVVLATVFVVGIVIVIAIAYFILVHFDSKKDYSRVDIKYVFYSGDDGKYHISVPYFVWQTRKRYAIKDQFVDIIEFKGRKYEITASHPDQPVLNEGTSVIYKRSYVFDLQYISKYVQPQGNIQSVVIGGSARNIEINQTIDDSIALILIDDFIDSHSSALCDEDISEIKDFIEAYRIGQATKNKRDSIISTIANYSDIISAATAIATLVSGLTIK
jgi:hypothetical protein